MPKVNRAKFEQTLVELRKSRKPAPHWTLREIATRIENLLEETGVFLIQKSTKAGQVEAMLELTATWLGSQADERGATGRLESVWPGKVFDEAFERHTFYPRDENLVLAFAAEIGEDRYVSGRIAVML